MISIRVFRCDRKHVSFRHLIHSCNIILLFLYQHFSSLPNISKARDNFLLVGTFFLKKKITWEIYLLFVSSKEKSFNQKCGQHQFLAHISPLVCFCLYFPPGVLIRFRNHNDVSNTSKNPLQGSLKIPSPLCRAVPLQLSEQPHSHSIVCQITKSIISTF